MNEKLPRTPFSTPFSPSKKMVEARIRGVIAGPQKRPPLPLLVLVLAFCFFSVNLVSCQPAEVEKNSYYDQYHSQLAAAQGMRRNSPMLHNNRIITDSDQLERARELLTLEPLTEEELSRQWDGDWYTSISFTSDIPALDWTGTDDGSPSYYVSWEDGWWYIILPTGRDKDDRLSGIHLGKLSEEKWGLADELFEQAPTVDDRLHAVDLNRNGIPETIETSVDIDAGRHRLTILENGVSIYDISVLSEDLMRTAVFLYRDGEGQDWLLNYVTILVPDDYGEYYYQVYRLDGWDIEEASHKHLTFDLSFSGDPKGYGEFDPEAIAAYIDEVNALMADSTLLLCTDSNLKTTFDRLGRLEDDLWWINLDYIRDPDKPLVDTLREYQAVKEAAVSNRPAVPYVPAPGTPKRQAALGAYRAVLEDEATFYSTDISRNVDMPHIGEVLGLTFANADHLPAQFTLVDLDGDGVEELALDYRLGNGGTIVMFHYQGGEVLGYYKFGRGFQDVKTDGAYAGSGGAFTRYLLRITSFDRSGFTEETTAYYDYHDPNTFMLHDQPSTEQTVTALFDQHNAKEDVTWYDLNDANIKAAFS